MRSSALLSIIGGIHPEVWDAVIPHHHHHHRYQGRADLVSLNPQPLPPGPENLFLIGAADLAHRMAQLAVEQNAAGRAELHLLQEWIDDWCGNGWPFKWPIPWPGPRGDGPLPDPWVVKAGQVMAATVLASTASRLADGELNEVFNDLAERLVDAASG
jgi:hypothetical protein